MRLKNGSSAFIGYNRGIVQNLNFIFPENYRGSTTTKMINHELHKYEYDYEIICSYNFGSVSGCSVGTFSSENQIIYYDGNKAIDYDIVKKHSIVLVHECINKKIGYAFIGWALTPNGMVEYYPGDECSIPYDQTSLELYAIWKANSNSIIFDSNGATGSMQTQIIKTGMTEKLNSCLFIKEGYSFAGWAVSASGSVQYADGADYLMGTNSSYTLYAIWVPNTNQICFVSNGGSGTMETQFVQTNSTVTLNACTYIAPEGHYFAGWSNVANGEVAYLDCSLFTAGTNGLYKLFAIWKKI